MFSVQLYQITNHAIDPPQSNLTAKLPVPSEEKAPNAKKNRQSPCRKSTLGRINVMNGAEIAEIS